MNRAAFLLVAFVGVFWPIRSPIFAGPREEVLRAVPDDAGFCLLVADLRGTIDRIGRSPFAKRFWTSPVGKALFSQPEMNGIGDLERNLRVGFGSSLAEFRDEIAGDALALAYSPAPPAGPGVESALFLLHARNPQLLARLFDRLNELQKQSGELTDFQRREHRGTGYWLRRKKADGDEFAAIVGSLFLLSDKEDALRAAIDRATRAGSPLSRLRLAERITEVGGGAAAAVWWFNPRAFDGALKRKAAAADGPDAIFLRTFVRYWESLDDAAFSLTIGRDAELAFTVRSRPDALPANARRFLSEFSTPSAALAAFPADALFTLGGHIALETAGSIGGEFLSPEARQEIRTALDRSVGAVVGRDSLNELVRSAGPDWGLCVAPPVGKNSIPMVTAALRLAAGGNPAIARQGLEGLDFAARLAVFAFNSQNAAQWQLRTEKQGDVEVRFIDGEAGLLPGVRPAFAWKGGFIIVASSPEAIQRFEPQRIETNASREVLLARLALSGWAAYLRAHGAAMAAYVAEANKQPLAEVRARFDGLLAVIDLFDAAELTERAEPDRATLTLRLKPAASFVADAGARKNPTERTASRSNSGAGTEKRP